MEQVKAYPVNYSGYINLQDGPYYEDLNLLDAEAVGETEAIEYGNRFALCFNALSGLSNSEVEGLRDTVRELRSVAEKSSLVLERFKDHIDPELIENMAAALTRSQHLK